jgi:hypothetical protein
MWWEEMPAPDPETAEHAEQDIDETQEQLCNAENSVRQSAEQSPNGAEHSTDGERVDEDVRQETARVRQGSEYANGLGKRQSTRGESMFGMFGNSASGDSKCKHDVPGGCWLCQREIERLTREGMAAHLARAEVLG